MEKKFIQFSNIPDHLQKTFEWLLTIEDFVTVRSLAKTIFKFLNPDDPTSTDFLAYILQMSKSYREAAEVALKTVEKLPRSADALFNAAKCLNSAGHPDRAEQLIQKAIALRPDWKLLDIELAVFVSMQGRWDEAMKLMEEVLPQLPPDDKNADIVRYNLGWHLIRRGDFKSGIRNLSSGRKLNIWGNNRTTDHHPVLHPGVNLNGKTVLVRGDGGAGDEMINARFAKTIRDRGGRTIWAGQHPLYGLLSRSKNMDQVLTPEQVKNFKNFSTPYDFWVPGMDLPVALDLDLKEIPNIPYLSADASFIEKWKNKLTSPSQSHPSRKFRIGIRWQGNALYEQDLMRSVPFKSFERILNQPEFKNIEFYSLQRDEGVEELPKDSTVVNWGSDLKTWEDTAGAIENLDLIISSCTSVPHLSAAMGKPTWVLCPLNCYYVWASPGEWSAWYPSVRLFRQTHLHSWEEPFSRIVQELKSTVPRENNL